MANTPYYFDQLNRIRGSQLTPNNLIYDSQTYNFFKRSLYQRFISKFDFTLPEYWIKDTFIATLVLMGFTGVFDTDKFSSLNKDKGFGIIPMPSTVYGVGVQYQPTKIKTASQYFKMPSKGQIINKEAGCIKLTPDYMGLYDIIEIYAQQFAVLWGAIGQSIQNTRNAYLIGANNKAGASALEWMMDKRNSGKPWIVFNKEMLKKEDAATLGGADDLWTFIDFNVGRNYITDKQLRDFRILLSMFDNEIGIPNVATEKAERLISNEVESNSAETVARFTTWMECLTESIEKCIEVFPSLEGQLAVKARIYDTGQTGAKEAAGGVDYGNS